MTIDKITLDTTLGDLYSDKRTAPFAHRLGLDPGNKSATSLGNILDKTPPWKHGNMLYGMERMLSLVSSSDRFCIELYTEAEKADDKSCKGTALYYFPTDKTGAPFVLICPGGAYAVVESTVEGFPVAARLNEMGYNAFVLCYRTGINTLGRAKEDLMRALEIIFKKAHKLGVSTKDYAVMGFSAGGHLASLCLTDRLNFEKSCLPRPKTAMLCYPLTNFTNGPFIIKVCKICAFGFFASKKKIAADYVPGQILQNAPSVYMWQTKDDEAVPFEHNSVVLAKSLKNKGIRFMFRTVDHGPHGMGIAQDSGAYDWLDEAVAFWRE